MIRTAASLREQGGSRSTGSARTGLLAWFGEVRGEGHDDLRDHRGRPGEHGRGLQYGQQSAAFGEVTERDQSGEADRVAGPDQGEHHPGRGLLAIGCRGGHRYSGNLSREEPR